MKTSPLSERFKEQSFNPGIIESVKPEIIRYIEHEFIQLIGLIKHSGNPYVGTSSHHKLPSEHKHEAYNECRDSIISIINTHFYGEKE